MSLIEWTEDYSVNVKAMDERHKKLVQLINGFYDALQSGMGQEVVPGLLEGVIDYTKTHFSMEEGLLKEHGYPEYDSHKTEHDNFTNKVMAIQKKYTGGDKSVIGEVALLLSEWLMDHIVMKDKKYGVYLNGKGVN